MPVTKSDAIAAVKALNGSVEAIVRNTQYHDKSHWSKHNATAALADKPECGYYWKKLSRDKWTRPTDGDVTYEKPTPKKLKSYKKTTETSYLEVNVNDCWILVCHAFGEASKGNVELKEGNTVTRFILAAPFPGGYGGETVRRGSASESCAYIVVVIETGGGATNAQLVTHFPAAQSYIDEKTDLV